jgi:glutaredoxin
VKLARLAFVFVLAASGAEQGRVHITDTLPPSSAKDVRRLKPAAGATAKPEPTTPFVLQQAMKDYPVKLYTSPGCEEPCAQARDLLNRRGIPFQEVQVWEEESNQELKRVSGGNQVPAITVGATAFSGFERSAYDALLDSAGYPRAGILRPRAQAAPERPEGYVPAEEGPKAEPVKPAPPAPRGPYSPR